MPPNRGHRLEPHTADVILHAWGPDLAGCFEEAVAALLAICIDSADVPPARRVTRRFRFAEVDSMLLDLLDEIIFVMDTETQVPIRARISIEPDGDLGAVIDLVAYDNVEIIGASPKAISRSELTVTQGSEGVSCSVLVDV
jgi:SHS2 domain-containing protein